MDLGLTGKVALVSGASEGMGRASAATLAREGAHVAMVARTEENLERAAKEIENETGTTVVRVVADVTVPSAASAAVEQVVGELGGVDVLVNTVGLCEVVVEGILAEDDDFWDRSYQSVLMANVRMARLVVPYMRMAGGGAIVNIAAMSVRHYLPMLAHYSAMKAALAHFTKNMAREFAPDGIRINAVMPGMIESEGVHRRKEARKAAEGWDDDQFFDYVNTKYLNCTWADRLGSPSEIADAVAFLASERASYVNGAWLTVDGGSAF